MALKTKLINLAASWSTAIRGYMNGDLFDEANSDSVFGDIADRLGYLKTQSDLSPRLAGPTAYTGTASYAGAQTFSSTCQFNAPVTHTAQINSTAKFVTTGAGGGISCDASCTATFACSVVFQGAGFNDDVSFNAGTATFVNCVTQTRGRREGSTTLTNADSTIGATTSMARVPTVTANRVYTMPANVGDGRIVRIVRPKLADAWSVTIQNQAAATLAVIGASSQAWVELQDLPSFGWAVIGWGGTSVTSIITT